MSTKKINVGDILTAGDLTDDHLGAEIEVGPIEGMRTRMILDRIEEAYADVLRLFTPDGGYKAVSISRPVKIITPPPVVQPDEPTILGQMFRVEGMPGVHGFRANDTGGLDVAFWWERPSGTWTWDSWSVIKRVVGDRRIIVSDPPRWPDETPEADETLPEVVETLEQWDALPLEERRKFTWATSADAVAEPVACGGWWYRGESNLGDDEKGWPVFYDTEFPLTRGERVE